MLQKNKRLSGLLDNPQDNEGIHQNRSEPSPLNDAGQIDQFMLGASTEKNSCILDQLLLDILQPSIDVVDINQMNPIGDLDAITNYEVSVCTTNSDSLSRLVEEPIYELNANITDYFPGISFPMEQENGQDNGYPGNGVGQQLTYPGNF